jgi:hypothetical protein
MPLAKFVEGQTESERFWPSDRNTSISQRETLEAAIINLATTLGIFEVHRILSSGGHLFYAVADVIDIPYQSASNTILSLSQHCAHRAFPDIPEPSFAEDPLVQDPEKLNLVRELAYEKAEQRGFLPGFEREGWEASLKEAEAILAERRGNS